MCPFRPDYIVETKNSYELVESVSGACRNQGEILEFDKKVGSNRTLAKNLARMFLKIVSEVDGVCHGKVTQIGKLFEERYEDGDAEDLTRKELLGLLD